MKSLFPIIIASNILLGHMVASIPTPCNLPNFLVNTSSIYLPGGNTAVVTITNTTPPASGPVTFATSISNVAVATVTQPVGGTFSVTGVSTGNAVITITGTSSCGPTTSTIGVTVP